MGDGVLLARIDMPGRSMNVFSEALIDELERLIDRVDADQDVLGVVVTSGKASFLAGADLAMVRGMTQRAATDSREQMFEFCGRLGRLFLRIEQSAKPWVAAVNGTALGGGLELAMACAARLIDTDPKALLGLPEVKLGLLPGAGGTQRLPRFVGLALGLDLLVSGRSLSPDTAIKAGLFEPVPPGHALLAAAQARLHALRAAGAYSAQAKFPFATLNAPADDELQVRGLAQALKISDDALRDYPAYRAIIRSVLAGAALPLPQANDVEMTRFLDLMFDPVAGNMVNTLFLQRQRVEKIAANLAKVPPNALAIGVLSDHASAWHDALVRTGVTMVEVAALPKDTIEVPLDVHTKVRLSLTTVAAAPLRSSFELTLVLSERSAHGRVVELLTGSRKLSSAEVGVIAALVRKMQSLLVITPQGGSVLRLVADAAGIADAASPADSAGPAETAGSATGASLRLDAMAAAAVSALSSGQADDPAALDVALVLAGIAPAYSGGPCHHLWHNRQTLGPQLQQQLGDAYSAVQQRLAASLTQEHTL